MDVEFELTRGRRAWSARVTCCWFPSPSSRRARGRFGRARLVLAEGEATGHAHVVDDERASLHRQAGVRDDVSAVSRGHEPVLLVHEEHDPLPLWRRVCMRCGASASTRRVALAAGERLMALADESSRLGCGTRSRVSRSSIARAIERRLRQANRSAGHGRSGRIEWVGSLEAYIRRSADLLLDGWTLDDDGPFGAAQALSGRRWTVAP